ncbi:conserved hypothetical protein [delta proteobacterium NaphS2]|nr:conserved hypothetical protein [delta proteobacterium NaphS2]
MPPAATQMPPIKRMGWMDILSDRDPKKRLESTIPNITAETVRETFTGVT